MRKIRIILLAVSVLTSFYFYSCDDSGVNPKSIHPGAIRLSWSFLKRLDQNVDGVFQLWLLQDSAGATLYYSLSRFNVSLDGTTLVDESGGPAQFKYTGDTLNLQRSSDVLLTVEAPGVNRPFPGPTHLLSCFLNHTVDSLTGTLTLNGSRALGHSFDSLGNHVYLGPHGMYQLEAPTSVDPNADCLKGLWFCRQCNDANPHPLPRSMKLDSSSGWVYEGWVADTSNPAAPVYYSMGRFLDPTHADFDGAGMCSGPNPGLDAPGQDWIQNNCPQGKPQITNLRDGFHQVFITIEPANEIPGSNAYNSPFFMKVFWQSLILQLCNRADNIFNQSPKFPEMRIWIQTRH